jgi:glycosyltransferase involved in cell wall biosynthesis
MKIAISARSFTGGYKGTDELIEGLVNGFVRYWPNANFHVFCDRNILPGHFKQVDEHILPVSNRFLWDHILAPVALWREKVDFTIFPKGPIPLVTPKPFGVFILDLGYFHPELQAYKTSETWYMRFILPYAVKHAEVVWAISEYTRKEVVQIFGCSPDKVKVAYLAPHERYKPVTDDTVLSDAIQKYGLQFPFIFYPTSISPRKNIERLLLAFKDILKKIPHHLYLTGGMRWNNHGVKALLRDENLADRVHLLGQVPPNDMPTLYTLAEFTVYPSLFEGFGLPVVEAFKCGSPVLVSGETSLPEVAGDAALYVDAYDVLSIRDGMLRMATDPDLRADLTRKGYQQAKKFSWEKTITSLVSEIQKIVERGV